MAVIDDTTVQPFQVTVIWTNYADPYVTRYPTLEAAYLAGRKLSRIVIASTVTVAEGKTVHCSWDRAENVWHNLTDTVDEISNLVAVTSPLVRKPVPVLS